MKITAPDHEDIYFSTNMEPNTKEEEGFKKEIKDILKIPSVSPKYVVSGSQSENPDFKLQVLHKFTQFCREEMIPLHQKAADLIEAKIKELQSQMEIQQKESQHLANERILIAETSKRLDATRLIVKEKHKLLSDRLKVTLHVLKNQCANKTVAERKMAQDLKNYQESAKNIRVKMTETSAKVKYLNSQMNAQLELARRYTQPLYLDKNRVVFIRSNLTSMQKNIQQLVNRVKCLNKQMPMLTASCPVENENSLRSEGSELETVQH